MGALVYSWLLLVTMFHFGTSQAFFNDVRPCFPAPRYDNCKDIIESLKALLEITQSQKPDPSLPCPKCATPLSEELIIKLVNALIYTATQNCGFNGKGCGREPANNGGSCGNYICGNNGGSTGGCNSGVVGDVGNDGGLKSGDNTVFKNGDGVSGSNHGKSSGGNSGVVSDGGNDDGVVAGDNPVIKNGDGVSGSNNGKSSGNSGVAGNGGNDGVIAGDNPVIKNGDGVSGSNNGKSSGNSGVVGNGGNDGVIAGDNPVIKNGDGVSGSNNGEK